MTCTLRIALLVDPLTVLVKGARHAVELSRELDRRGHDVRLFGAPPALIAGAAGADDPTAGYPDDGQALGPARPVRLGGVLGFEPDVVVAYDALSPVALLGSRAARRRRVPLILVENKLQAGSPVRRVLARLGETLWGRYVRGTASGLVALDPLARDQAVSEGFDPASIRTLPQGVDLERFRPGLSSPLLFRHRVRGRILLHAGSHESHAGLEMLIEAFARTVGQRGDWSLVLAGRRGAPPRLRAAAHRSGVGARVHFLKVTDADLPALYASSTLVAQPALDDRTTGLSVLRAMACGRPVLASALPRLAFAVEAEGSGLLAPADDLAAWTRMIQRAAHSPVARRRWGRRGREIAEERFAWSKLAADWEATILGAAGEVDVAALESGEAARA
jgi:glycosyltransferase involved in cell wall biosynthesis